MVYGWTKNTPKCNFFEIQNKIIQNAKTQKHLEICQKKSYMPFDQRSLIHREAWFPPSFVRQNQQKKKKNSLEILDHFQTKNIQIRGHFFPFLFPKDSEYQTSGSGGKKTFKRYLKSEHTDGQTDRQTDKSTEGRCFEKSNAIWCPSGLRIS